MWQGNVSHTIFHVNSQYQELTLLRDIVKWKNCDSRTIRRHMRSIHLDPVLLRYCMSISMIYKAREVFRSQQS